VTLRKNSLHFFETHIDGASTEGRIARLEADVAHLINDIAKIDLAAKISVLNARHTSR
jgi:hypothetical protein